MIARRTEGHLLVVALQPLDASTTLFFGHLADRLPGRIRIVRYGHPGMAAAIAQAKAIVLVRGLFEFSDIVRCARILRIPLYYFLDDNFMVLREQGGNGARFVGGYSVEAVREGLRDFEGVLLATPALIAYCSEQRLHHRLFQFPPVMGGELLAAPPGDEPRVTVAFFGGQHLHRPLLDIIVPAVRRLARQRPLHLLVVGVPDTIPESEGLSVSQQSYQESYPRGLRGLAAAHVDVFVHPVAAGAANNVYKNPHALISAHALGAIPVVSKAPPYDALEADRVALMCEDNEESWLNALIRAVSDETLRSTLSARLGSYCAEQFSGSPNRAVVEMMLAGYTPNGWAQMVWRRGIAHGCQGMSLARRVAERVAKAAGLKAVAAAV